MLEVGYIERKKNAANQTALFNLFGLNSPPLAAQYFL